MNFLSKRNLLTLVAAASLAACSSVKLDDPAVESRTGAAVVGGSGTAGGSTSGGAVGSSQTRVAPVDATAADQMAMGNLPRIVYFDYDSYVVKDDQRPVIDVNAKALSADARRRMSVQGHTDDRGSSEYNLSLGQRRAEAVVRSLTLLGAQAAQLEAVSFGKERPAVQGAGEDAWAKNRRAELAAGR